MEGAGGRGQGRGQLTKGGGRYEQVEQSSQRDNWGETVFLYEI